MYYIPAAIILYISATKILENERRKAGLGI